MMMSFAGEGWGEGNGQICAQFKIKSSLKNFRTLLNNAYKINILNVQQVGPVDNSFREPKIWII